MLELVGPILQRDELLNKIDFSILDKLDIEFGIKDITLFAQETQLEEILQHKKNTNAQEMEAVLASFGTSTKLFFCFMESISKLFVPILKQAENMSTQLERLEKDLEKMSNGDFRKQMMKKYVDSLRNEFFMFRVCLEDDERLTLVNQFYNKFFTLVLPKMSTGIVLPGHFLTDFIEFQTFFANIKKNYFSVFGLQNFKLYLDFLDVILSDQFRNSNRYIKAKYLDLLFTFNIIEKGNIVHVLKEHLATHDRIVTFLRAILGFYSEIEFMTDNGSVSQMKHRYRFFITKFLLKALLLDDYAQAFLTLTNSEEVSSYVGHLVTDLNFFLDEGFEKLKKISSLQSNTDANIGRPTENNPNLDVDQETLQTTDNESIPAMVSQVKGLFKFGRSQLALMELLAKIAPNIFAPEQWANKIGQTINYYTSKMCSKSYRSYKITDMAKVNLKPLEFIRQLIYIYVGMSAINSVKTAILNDDRSYSAENLIDLGRTAFIKSLVSEATLRQFEAFIGELQDLKIEKDAMEEIIGEIPDEFQCGFTYELMLDPVMLPASKTIVNRNSIRQHITLNGEFDPFTKAKLTLDLLVELPELKQRIAVWLKDKKEEYAKKSGLKKLTLDVIEKGDNDLEDFYSSETDGKSEKRNYFEGFK